MNFTPIPLVNSNSSSEWVIKTLNTSIEKCLIIQMFGGCSVFSKMVSEHDCWGYSETHLESNTAKTLQLNYWPLLLVHAIDSFISLLASQDYTVIITFTVRWQNKAIILFSKLFVFIMWACLLRNYFLLITTITITFVVYHAILALWAKAFLFHNALL